MGETPVAIDQLTSFSFPHSEMATRIESSEFKTVRGKFVAICDCISEPDVVKYAGELLQSNLISDAGHQAAIAVTGLPPANKVAHLVSEAANNVSNSPDNFYKFISILESRNVQLASTLRSDYVERRHSSGLLNKISPVPSL